MTLLRESGSVGLRAYESHLMTDKETTLPPISGLFETRGDCHRPSLNRVEDAGRLTLSRETVGRRLLGHAKYPTILDTRGAGGRPIVL
jgi:hypothetical protein